MSAVLKDTDPVALTLNDLNVKVKDPDNLILSKHPTRLLSVIVAHFKCGVQHPSITESLDLLTQVYPISSNFQCHSSCDT